MSTQATDFTVSPVAPNGAIATATADNRAARDPGSTSPAPSDPPQQKQGEAKETGASPKQEEKKDFLAPRFAALTKKEKALVQQQRELKSIEQRIAEQRAELERWEKAKSEAHKDPIGFLEKELKLSYEDLTKTVLNDKRPPAEIAAAAAQREIEKLRKEQEEKEEKKQRDAEQRERQEAQQAYNQFVESTVAFVEQNAETYEFIKLYEGHRHVVDVIQQYYDKTGRILSQKEAADFTEKWYEDRLEKATASKKWSNRAKAETQPEGSKPRTPSAQPRTVDNSFTTSAATTQAEPADGPLPYEERVKRALSKMDAVMAGVQKS